jgi:transposase
VDAAIKENVSYDALNGVIDRNIQPAIDWKEINCLDIIGIDEIALKKGHQDFVVIVTARQDDETHILAVLEERSKQAVKQFFLALPDFLGL